MKIKHFLFMILFPAVILAEGGSPYTRIGLGDLYYSYSARRASFGGLGAAVFDKMNIGNYNPASWTRLNMARFESGINVESFFTKGQNKSSFFSNAFFSGFVLGIPIEKDYGISLVMGIVPYSKVKLNVSEVYPDYNFTFAGDGNVTKLFIGGSYSLPFDFSIGASLDYYIGTTDYYSDIIFNDANTRDAEYDIRHKLSGIGGTFGFISNDLSKSFNINIVDDLRLGAVLSIAGKMDTDTTMFKTIYSGNKAAVISQDTLAEGKATTEIPFRLGAGISFTSGKYLFLLDYLFQPWSDYTLNGIKNNSLRNLSKIFAGFEYQFTNESSADFWRKIIYRGGVSYESSQYIIDGKGINQLSISGGMAFPLEYGSTIDLALEYGMRGETQLNLVKENIFKFTVSFNFGELWFYRGRR
jgi:hypothetical protein